MINCTITSPRFLALLYSAAPQTYCLGVQYVVRPSVRPSPRAIHCVATLRHCEAAHCVTFPYAQFISSFKKTSKCIVLHCLHYDFREYLSWVKSSVIPTPNVSPEILWWKSICWIACSLLDQLDPGTENIYYNGQFQQQVQGLWGYASLQQQVTLANLHRYSLIPVMVVI